MKNKIAQLDHLNFSVKNFQESVDWYKKIFNFNLVEQGTSQNGLPWGILKSGDNMLAISEHPNSKIPNREDYHQMFHFGLRLIDEQEWRQKVEQFQLETFYSSPVIYPNSKSWYVVDPTGNMIEVAIWHNNKVKFSSPEI